LQKSILISIGLRNTGDWYFNRAFGFIFQLGLPPGSKYFWVIKNTGTMKTTLLLTAPWLDLFFNRLWNKRKTPGSNGISLFCKTVSAKIFDGKAGRFRFHFAGTIVENRKEGMATKESKYGSPFENTKEKISPEKISPWICATAPMYFKSYLPCSRISNLELNLTTTGARRIILRSQRLSSAFFSFLL
jgi:hypothetical protein